jgi:hypothetical protein
VGSVIAQYDVYEDAEDEQNVAYDSPGQLTGANFVVGKGVASYGGAGRYNFHPTVKYVTPEVTSHGESLGTVYSDPTAYYGAGDHSGVGYGGAFRGHGDLDGRVRIQVSFKSGTKCRFCAGLSSQTIR